jgi:hypothetical protein
VLGEIHGGDIGGGRVKERGGIEYKRVQGGVPGHVSGCGCGRLLEDCVNEKTRPGLKTNLSKTALSSYKPSA